MINPRALAALNRLRMLLHTAVAAELSDRGIVDAHEAARAMGVSYLEARLIMDRAPAPPPMDSLLLAAIALGIRLNMVIERNPERVVWLS